MTSSDHSYFSLINLQKENFLKVRKYYLMVDITGENS